MSNIDSMIMNAANTAAQQTQAVQQPQFQQQVVQQQQQVVQQAEYIPVQQQPVVQQQQVVQQGEYIPVQQQQPQYQQQVVHQQPQYQQQVVQPQYQQQVVQQQQQPQYQQQVVQQQPQYQQQVVQQQQPQYQQQNAGMISHQQANAVAVQQPQQQMMAQQQLPVGQLPAHLMQMPTNMSMEAFMNMGLSVDLWLKPDYVGMTVGENTTPVESVFVEIDMTEQVGFTPIFSIRYGANPVKYDYTRDGVTNKDGLSWQAALYQAFLVDPTVSPYRAVQIPMVVLQECKNMKGEVVASAGSSLGYTTSVTNFPQWEELYRLCMRQNLIGQKVAVKLTNVPKAKNNNKWGVVHFELLGAAANFKAA